MEDSKELRTEIYGKLSSNAQASLFLSRRRKSRRIRGSEGWRLSWHQVETWKALNDPDIDVIFNTASDGGREKSSGLPANFTRIFPDYGTLPNQRTGAGSAGGGYEAYIQRFQPTDRTSGQSFQLGMSWN
jgi:hypothetical protein